MYYETKDIVGGKEVVLNDPFTFRDHQAFFEIVSMIKNNNHRKIVFNLKDCDFIDSAALGMFVIAHDEASAKATNLFIKDARSNVKELMYAAKFDSLYHFE
ncbi:MAG: STAS domain-containing protein [Alphaproteobacteria bacterium]|nr:STAS domain-containing protein [Alphaproteobacteria bacterium]